MNSKRMSYREWLAIEDEYDRIAESEGAVDRVTVLLTERECECLAKYSYALLRCDEAVIAEILEAANQYMDIVLPLVLRARASRCGQNDNDCAAR